ncbi:MAG: SPOR domain-containing protein, partial [Sulfurovum sp.]|nr:SPOR domain-containing protein [Sulfurovaceae bacterium]
NEIKETTVEVYDDNKDVTPEKKVKQEPKIVEKPKIEEKKKIVEKSIVEKRPKKVEPVKEVKAKVEKREEKIREQPQSHKSEGSYYIQVGSFAQKPSSRFLSVISNSGFSYKLHPSGKLLIGSYSSRANAKRDLPRVKDRINKSAFVIRIK